MAHLLYARFWTKFLHERGLVSIDEPFQGLRYNGYILAPDNTKMSKSVGNVVDPVDLIDEGYGADALRMYELFVGPYEQSVSWNPTGIDGTKRFLNRVWTLIQEHVEQKGVDGAAVGSSAIGDTAISASVHKAIAKVTQDLEAFSFNTAIAALMECVNELYKLKVDFPVGSPAWGQNLQILVAILAPFAPHITEELWQQLGNSESVHMAAWPVADKSMLATDLMTIVLQINGKVRASIEVEVGATEAEVIAAAQANSAIKTYTSATPVKRTIYVPGKLVNFVV